MSVTDSGASKPIRGRGRPRAGEAAPNHEEIIDAAVRVIRRVGARVTMGDIAAEAGITKPIIYREIGDKGAVAEAVAEYLSLRIADRARQVLVETSNSEQRFRTATHMFFDLMWEERQLFSFVEYGWGSHDGLQLELMIDRAAAPLMDARSSVFEKTIVTDQRRRTWAYATVGALRTVAVMWVRQGYCSSEELVDDVVDFVLRGSEKSPPTR